MTKTFPELKRAKELLKKIRHAAMATVNKDGSPHNTPYKFMYSNDLKYLYWGSHPDSMHSQNVLRTGQLYVVLYEANEKGGLYIEASGGKVLQGKELKDALAVHNLIRRKEGKPDIPLSYYTGKSPQKMWSAKITNMWVNSTKRDVEGNLTKDFRLKINSKDLL